MGLHCEANLNQRFIETARQINLYLNHFPRRSGAATRPCIGACRAFDSAAGLTGNKTRFLLLDTTTGTLRRVEFGEADSGGTGYRMMRVAN